LPSADISVRPIKTNDFRLIVPIVLMNGRSNITGTG